MKFLLPFFALLTMGCPKKSATKTTEIQLIERDLDILNEEELEELPEN
tara:strand:+ start:5151 stop:5294 length:144 start_codon:yes stop_codon:yes gene_type:complete